MSSGAASRLEAPTARLRVATRRLPAWWGVAALGVLLVAGGAVLAYESRGTTFFQDEWSFILSRRGSSLQTFLEPHNQHLSLVPAVIYKLLFATAGMRHYWPYRACVIVAQLACVALVFFYAQPRMGTGLALLASTVIMFFGPGWQDILWPFQMAWVIAVAAGIGALIALDRDTRFRNALACALLGISLASAGPGLAVAAGLIVEVAWRRPRRQWWIVGVPIGLYVLWWIGYQQSSLVAHSLLLVPRFIFDAAAGVTSSLTGLAQINVGTDTGTYLQAGPALVAVGLGLATWRLSRLGRVPTRVITLAVIPVSFWIIAGVGRASAQIGGVTVAFTGDEGRYIYVGAVWTLLLAVELARGVRPGPWALAAITTLAVAVVLSNITPLRDGANLLRGQAQVTNSEIGTLEVTSRIVPPSFASNGFIFFAYLTAGGYFAAQHDLGSSAPTPAQIASYSEPAREAADAQLIRIHHPTLVTASGGLRRPSMAPGPPAVDASPAGTYSIRSSCIVWRPSGSTGGPPLDLTLPAGGLRLRTRGQRATVSVRRFADAFQPLGTLAAASSAVLRIGADLAPEPWHVQIASANSILACAL